MNPWLEPVNSLRKCAGLILETLAALLMLALFAAFWYVLAVLLTQTH